MKKYPISNIYLRIELKKAVYNCVYGAFGEYLGWR